MGRYEKLRAAKKDTEEQRTTSVPVQYDGEFVLTSEGNRDFGEIPPQSG
jgi:hypothetical protein